MANPGRDLLNLVADDVLAPKRQAEIEAVVDSLASFAPTKVAVEFPWNDPRLDARYADHLAGRLRDHADETVQIGFRLGQRLGHARIHGIDVQEVFWDEALDRALEVSPKHRAQVDEMMAHLRVEIESDQLALETSTIGAFLARMNEAASRAAAHEPYLRYFAGVIHDGEHVGATVVANWYRRNLKIFANLLQLAEPSDRIFVLYGAGHIPLLSHFAESSGIFDVIDPLPYLRD